jgi:hypothetical protein
VDGLDRIEHFRGTLGKQVGEARSGARADQRHAIFRQELLVEPELLGLERVVREVGIQIEVMGPQPQRRAQDDLVENGGRSVYDQVGPATGADDGPQIPGVRFDDLDPALLTQESARPLDIAIAAPDGVALARQEMCQQPAGAARSENEYPHRPATLSHRNRGWLVA